MGKFKLFLISAALTTCVSVAVMYIQSRPRPQIVPIKISESDSVYLTPQLSLFDVSSIKAAGINTIVDMRPDNEAKDQPNHEQMEQAASLSNIGFKYLPVPHESIPLETVDALGEFLTSAKKPVVLYCRTGRRAVRTYALVQASQPDGPNAEAILTMVKNTGFTAEDLRNHITIRIASRTPSEAKP